MSEETLSLKELAELCALLNSAEPWPEGVCQITLTRMADRLAKRRGFVNWIHAHECFEEKKK